jgi:hypothetical protein
MNILSFSKLTRPIYESGISLDLRPKGSWQVCVRRTDGTYRYPFGDKYIPNLFINRFANGLLGAITQGNFNRGDGFGWSTNRTSGTTFSVAVYSLLSGYFFGTTAGRKLAIGSSNIPVDPTQTSLQAEIRSDSAPTTGNYAAIDFSSGGITYNIAESFPVETSTVTYREAAIKFTTPSGSEGEMINGLSSPGILNRVVFPSDVTLTSGESLLLKVAITTQSAANTDGIPINIDAQNGMNVSGKLKCIGTASSILGGIPTSIGGNTTNDIAYPLLFGPTMSPKLVLITENTFFTQNVNPTWGTALVNGTWSSYASNSRYRDVVFTMGNNVPNTNFVFQSICFRDGYTTGSVQGGYQLLLDNQMTKATNATFIIGLRFNL